MLVILDTFYLESSINLSNSLFSFWQVNESKSLFLIGKFSLLASGMYRE